MRSKMPIRQIFQETLWCVCSRGTFLADGPQRVLEVEIWIRIQQLFINGLHVVGVTTTSLKFHTTAKVNVRL